MGTKYFLGKRQAAGQINVTWCDTWLQANAPDTNYDATSYFRIHRQVPMRALHKVNFLPWLNANISSSSEIVSAAVWYRMTSDSNANTHQIALHYVPYPWDVATATWNNARTGTAWPTAGGVFRGTIEDEQLFDDTTGDQNIFKPFVITQLVKDIYDDVIPSAGGFMLKYPIEDGTSHTSYFWASEETVGSSPYLEIVLSNPASGGGATVSGASFDTFTFSDEASATGDLDFSISDGFTLSDDTSGSGWERTYTRFDGFKLSDNNTGSGVEFTKPASSGIILTDTSVGGNITSGGASDTFTLSDSAGPPILEYDASLSDGFDLAETITTSADYVDSISDQIVISDTASSIQTFIESINDGLSLSDTGTAVYVYAPSATDGITFSEGLSALNNTFNPSASDTFVFTEVSYPGYNEFLLDTVTFNASAGFNQTVYAESISDAFIMIDTGTVGLITSGAGIDSLVFSDTDISGIETDDVVSDVLMIGETLSNTLDASAASRDTFVFTDSSVGTIDYINIIADGFSFSDTSAPGIIELLRAIDGFKLTETLSSSANYIDTLTDSIVFGDPAGGTFAGVALTINGKQITLTFIGRREK